MVKKHSTLGKVSFWISIAILVILLSGFLMIQYEFFKYDSADWVQFIVFVSVPPVALSNLIVSTACLFDSTKRRLLPMISFSINFVIFALSVYALLRLYLFFDSFDGYNIN